MTPAADRVLLPVPVKDKEVYIFLCIAACTFLKIWKSRHSVKHSVKCILNAKKHIAKSLKVQ